MTSVEFPFLTDGQGGFRPVEFKFTVTYTAAMETAAGCDVLSMREKLGQTNMLIYWVCYAQKWKDDGMSIQQARKQLERFVDAKGDVLELTQALVKALNRSGVLGKSDEPDVEEEGEGDRPTGANPSKMVN